ncbi:uncharacterized protein LOC119008777 [Acanthopagrus latus]|uniref:uncharacterized protein LOC119008777 n=1 Tax=Acanthopagrus latus TaxID=8177 RepID=UPI00187CA1DC|nr:uncharacterized protein LOC119008777 [Acanthopagrus latus]
MLDQRTVRFGRTGKISADSFIKSFFEWEAVRYEVDSICKEEPFTCPACSRDMLAVSVDGNRKHYRFKNAARSEEQAIFDGVFIAKDEDVTRFINYIQSTTKHISGRGICGGEWSAARETSQRSASKLDEEGLELAVCRHGVLLCALNMYRGEIFAYPLYLQQKLASSRFFCMDVTCKYWPYLQRITKSCPELQHLLNMKPFLSVFHAKAHDFKCEVKWSGAYQEGAGLTLGEEVEQCLEDWVSDVKEWAEATTNESSDAAALTNKIEVLVASIKRRSQRLYKDTDSNKGRARIRRKIREEKGILTSVVEKYNRVVPSTETLCMETILSRETAWPWQLPHSDFVDLRTKRRAFDMVMAVRRLQEEKMILVMEMKHHWRSLSTRSDSLKELSCLVSRATMQNSSWGLSEDGLKGLQSIIRKKQHNIRDMMANARYSYLQVLTGAQTINFLHSVSDDYSDSDSDISDDALCY